MKLSFYHYVHCPFCVRVRMTLGFLNLPYESIVLPYDDEATPIQLSGKKMLPIMVIDGKPMNESLDIMQALDRTSSLKIPSLINVPAYVELNDLLNILGKNVHNLAMPYWIYTPEFNSSSREYFQTKKEQKRGPFSELVKKQGSFMQEIQKDLQQVEINLQPFYQSSEFSLYDILIAAHIWGLYVVPEFQFSDKMHNYLQRVKQICRFNYHEDFWSK